MKLKKVKKFLSLFLVLCMLIGNLNVMNVSATGTDDNYQTTTETEESKDDEAADVPADTLAEDTPAEDIPAADTPAAEEPAADAPAVVASEDPADTEGWVDVYLDDENIEYNGAWTIEMVKDGKSIDSAFCYDLGAKATLTFYGTGIRWYGQNDTNFGEAIVKIDGQEAATVDTNGSAKTSVLHYENTSLTEGTHTISIEPKEQGVRDVSGCIDIEKFEVLNSSAMIPVSEIEMSIDKATIYAGNTAQITATFKPFNATNKELTYTSSDAEVATVDANGLVTGLKAGTVTITGTVSGSDATDSVALTVKEQGAKAPLRMTIDEEHPLFLHHLYLNKNQVANNLPGPLEGGKSIQGFWDALVNGDENGNQLPEAVRDRQVLIIHAGGNVQGTSDTLAWYEARFDETVKDQIPFVIMVSNSGTGDSNSNYLPPATDWVAQMYEKYPNMMGVIFSENHNATNAREARSAYMNEMVLLAREYGGYVFYSDMNDNGDYVETVLDDQTLFNTLKANKDNFVLLAKTTSAWSNVSYNSHESVAMGAWMADIAGNWGSLIDSWMWFIEGFGPLYGNETFSVIGGAEECRGPVTFPELLFEMRMIQQARAGATVFTFEHPDYSTGIGKNSGADTYFTPAFTEAIVKAMEYMTEYEIPGKDEVLAATKVAYAAKNGTLNDLAGAGVNLLNPLYGDTNHNGYNGTTMMTYSTGRYGTVPSLPELATAEDEAQFDYVLTKNDVVSMGSSGIKTYFDALYPQTYQGTGYAHYLNNTWYAYNSNWNIDSRVAAELHEDQYVDLALENNNTSANITFDPYTTVLVDDQTEGKLRFKFNNYLVDKNEIWEGYNSSTPHWDSDNNQLMYNWIMNEYIPDAETEDDTYRQATIVLDNLTAEPTLTVVKELTNADGSKQANAPETTWDAEAGTYTIELDGNGWMTFDVTLNGTGEGGETTPDNPEWVDVPFAGGDIVYEGTWNVDGTTGMNTYEAGAKATLVFYGTGIKWVGQNDTNFGKAKVTIDDGEPVEVNVNGSAETGKELFVKENLTKGVHTITIEAVGGTKQNGVIDINKFVVFYDKDWDIPVSSLEASTASDTLFVGKTKDITVNVQPFNASTKTATFTSSDKSVATVDSNGVVTGVKAGNVKITVKVDGKTTTVDLIVKESVSRLTVDNEHPLLLVPVYVQDGATGELQWGDTLLGRWKSVKDIQDNVVMVIHGSHASTSNIKSFYKNQLDIAEKNGIPVVILTATAGQQSAYTSTHVLDSAWLEEQMASYDCLKGFMISENHWLPGSVDTIVAAASEHMRIAAEYGGYLFWFDHNRNDYEHKVFSNTDFQNAIKAYGDHVVFGWKNTASQESVKQNANSSAYVQGLWLDGQIAQWGGIMDTWKWHNVGYNKIFEDAISYNGAAPNGEDEECRAVVMEPESVLGMEMLSIYANGGCVYSFEHPAYTQGINDENTPLYENVIYETFKYIVDNPAPTRTEILEDTKVFLHGDLNVLSSNLYSILTDNAQFPLYRTGQYGVVPALPAATPIKNIDSDIVVNVSDIKNMSKADCLEYLNERYTEGAYEGTAFAQKLSNTDTWVVYNSKFNEDVDQYAEVKVGTQSVKVDVEPHTFAIMEKAANGISVYLNNYRVNKDKIWENYGPDMTKWDPDVNKLMEAWLEDNYMENAEDGKDTYRETVFTLTGLNEKPEVAVTSQKETDFTVNVAYDEATKAATITVKANGFVYFDITNIVSDGGQEEPEEIITYLSDIPWIEQSCGGGFETTKDSTVVENGNVLKLTLKVDGNVQTFDKGLGIHAPSSVTYNVKNRGYLYFEAYAGVDYSKLGDYTNTNGNEGVIANFIVEIDGEKVAESGEMNPSKDAHCFKVEIPKGAETITLITETGANDWSDWGDWADAKFAGVPVEPVPAEGVEITAKRISYAEGTTIKEGRKAYLTANLVPTESTDEIVSWTSADESIATVEFDGEECTVTGVKAGSVEITATATSGAAGTITINVLEKKEAAPLRRVVDKDHILYLENYYWSDDFANKNGVAGNVPQEERVDSPVMLWNTVPDSLKENTVILLIAERSLNNTESIKQWIKDNVELCNANNIPCAVQNVNGETRMDNPIPIEFWEELAQNNPYLVGFNGAELYNRFNGDAREYMVDLIQMGVENGIHMMWTDTNTFDCEPGNGTNSGVLVDWLEYCPDLANVMRENKDYISLMYKESYGNPGTEALYLGMWLTDYIGNWGIASDWWHWQLDSNGALFDAGSGGDAWKQCLTWPEAMYTMDILRAASQGATCFKSEAQWYSNATKGMRTPGYQYSIAPFLEKLASGEYRIPTQEEVLADTKAIVVGRNNWNAFNYDGTYSQLYPSTDKYGIVPFVPSTCPTDVLNEKFEHVFNAPISKAQMDEIYTDDVTGGTAYCENYGDTYYFLNSSEDKNVTQNATFEPDTTGVNSVEITATPHTYGVITAEENKMTFSLGNYRIDKSEIWTDSKYEGGFSDMACYSYVWELCERMGVLSDPTDDTNHDTELRETVIEVVCDSKPAAVFAEANEYTRPYEYTENWNADTKTYTLTVKHNGIVDVELISNTEKVTELEITQIGETITALNVGETLKLYAEVNEGSTTGVVWTSSNEDVATVTNGKVYAKAAGTVTITAEADGVKDTITLTVSEVAVESITLSKSELTIMEGKTESISAEVKPDNATNKTVVWTSSNEAVAIAASNGTITAVKPGKATITAESANGIKANVLVTVEADPNPSKQITSGITATATSAYAGTSEGPASNVLDGKQDTIWHSNYGSSRNDTTDVLPISITLDLGKEYDINKVEYVPRSGAANGTVTKYNLYIDGERVVSEGTWELNEDVKAIEFAEPVKASKVTLEVLEGKGGFASAAEIRVYQLAVISAEVAPDTAALAAKVNEAAALDLTKYEDGTAKDTFKSALAAAQAQVENPTDQFVVDEALEALAAAQETLKLKDSTGDSDSGSGSGTGTGSGSGSSSSSSSDRTETSKPQTGTTTTPSTSPATPATQSGTTIVLKPSTTKPSGTTQTEATQPPAQDETDDSAEDVVVDTKVVEEEASKKVVEIVKDAVTVEEDKATVNIETVEKILEATEEGTTVILPLTEAKDGEDVNTAEISVDAVERIAESGVALTLEFADAKVILYAETLEALKEQAKGETIEIRVVPIEHHELLPKQQKALEEYEVVARVSAQIFCDGKYIGDFKGGKAIIAIPFTPQDGKDAEDYAVYYVAEDGTKEKKPSSYKNGYMLVETGHFSDYVIIYEGADAKTEDANVVIDEDTNLDEGAVKTQDEKAGSPIIPIIIVIVVIAAVVVFFVKKKKEDGVE